MRRRAFLSCAGADIGQHALASILPQKVHAVRSAMARRPDIRLRIENCSLDISNRVTIRTVANNGQVPGLTLRLTERKPVSIEVTNATSSAGLVHWHGLAIDSMNDGAMEEGQLHMDYGFMQLIRYTG
jgi:FtsP/CotA-like multicopper oxidase with cupredoxin domain